MFITVHITPGTPTRESVILARGTVKLIHNRGVQSKQRVGSRNARELIQMCDSNKQSPQKREISPRREHCSPVTPHNPVVCCLFVGQMAFSFLFNRTIGPGPGLGPSKQASESGFP